MRNQPAQNSKTTDPETSSPLLTVIIPVYNTAAYLEQCLESVIHQTYKNLEIICVDDGSTDDSPGISAKYAQQDSRITVITQANQGVASACNVGLDAATGEFIAFLDSDDWLDLFAFEHVMRYAGKDMGGVCFGAVIEYMSGCDIKGSYEDAFKIKFSGEVAITTQVILRTNPHLRNKIFRRSIIEKYHLRFPVENIIGEDVCFYYNIMPLVSRMYFLDEKLYHYRRRVGSITHDRAELFRSSSDPLKYVEEVYHFYHKWSLLPAWRGLYIEIFVRHYTWTVRWVPDYMKRKLKKRARKLVVRQRLPELALGPNPTITYLLNRHPSFWGWFFSKELTASARHHVIRIFGIKIKVRRKLYIARQERDAAKRQRQALMNKTSCLAEKSMEWYLQGSPGSSTREIEHLLDHSKRVLSSFPAGRIHQNFSCLFPQAETKQENSDFDFSPDLLCIWEIAPRLEKCFPIMYAMSHNVPLLIMSDGFLRSACTWANHQEPPRYTSDYAFTIDTKTCYYDATRASMLEDMLNDPDLIVTDEQKKRARACIDTIIGNKLSKYNDQPIYTPKIGRKGAPKVLVVDQSFGDMSIGKGLAGEATFTRMLQLAIEENPEADIIVKTHPDTMTGVRKGYYTRVEQKGRIVLMTAPVNPISLIQMVDKVYVCTSQFGFEALMCGKEVHVFGMPFYAGWGATIDDISLERRKRKRSMEEIFYITYIMYSWYVNPEKGSRCEIEEVMQLLLELRREYFRVHKLNENGLPV